MNQQQYHRTQQSSEYAAQVMQRLDGIWQQDYAKDAFQAVLSREAIFSLVKQTVDMITDDAVWMQNIRQLRARLMLRWIWRDCNGLTDVMTLTRELSDFADACVIAAKTFIYPRLVTKYGEPIGEDGELQDLIIIAMGKHGAQELNLSSDIDLIFAFGCHGETTGKKSIDVQKFCILWGQKLIALLEQVTADGFVFRVDMRLRPWGDGSALALSHVALEKYLIQHGREWERYAWIKARAITGGDAAKDLMRMVHPFVFRRYVDYTALTAMRDMKAMIEKEVARRNIADDVKLGAGGIREVEFIVQVFQLIYGGSRRELQERQCLIAMKHLQLDEFISEQAYQELREAYLFLRRVEHAIQALQDQQTQSLPQDEQLRARLIFALNYTTWEAFLSDLNERRACVSQHFGELIQDRHDALFEREQQVDMQDLRMHLDDDAYQRVKQFWQGNSVQRLPATALKRLKQFFPYLIQAVIESPQPQVALLRLLPLIESILRRSVYIVMLIENRGALQRLVKMASVSPWICEELIQYPVLLDDFLTMDIELPKRQDLEDELRQQLLRIELEHVEDLMRVLRLFKKSNVLAVAASDVLADSPLMRISDVLTDIAEITVKAVLHLAYQMIVKRYGYPLDVHGERCTLQQIGFAVIGYGKVGGIELGYGSDLDLVFIHNYDEQADTDGRKAITGLEFAMRVAQKFMSLMTTQTLDGRIYDIDTRLRPHGEAGLLVVGLRAFEQYQQNRAWLWEHQALVRARSIAGEEALCCTFEQLRCKILTQQRDEQTVRHEVIKMRQKMLDHLGSTKEQKKHGIFHLKQDAGGIVDIEFMAQYVVLAWSAENPELARYSDNVRILEDAAKLGCLSSSDAAALTLAYLSERAESHRLALANQSLQVKAADWRITREVVCKLWQSLIDPEMIISVDSE